MAELKDSGARRDFGTGAVRDVADGKGRCDLLPLGVIARTGEGDVILKCIDEYIRTGKITSLEFAIVRFSEAYFDNIETGMLEAAKQYEDGCQKYGERNWENGIPLHCYIERPFASKANISTLPRASLECATLQSMGSKV